MSQSSSDSSRPPLCSASMRLCAAMAPSNASCSDAGTRSRTAARLMATWESAEIRRGEIRSLVMAIHTSYYCFAVKPPGSEPMTSVLDGIRVLDLSWGIPGPITGMLVADHGADVVKIEPPGGDPWRGTPGYDVWLRGRRSAELDLHGATDR